MSSGPAGTRTSRDALRCVIALAADGAAAVCGMNAALVLTTGGGDAALATEAKLATPLVVLIRIATVFASRLHRPLRVGGSLGALWLFATMLAASLLFAVVCPTLPRPVYALEFFVTTSLMAAMRYAPSLVDASNAVCQAAAEGPFAATERRRRILNVIVALVGLLVTLPLWILIAIAIKATSRGPVLYSQERIGVDARCSRARADDPRRHRDLGGRPFMMYKFRTMRFDAETSTGAVWAAKQDARVTSVGRFLRHCRLDELPQLINVLKGDMNVVGPRPERPTIFAELRTRIPNYANRQRVPPGITGYAQVNLEYDATIDDVVEKLKYDLEYVAQHSPAGDLSIMARTVPVMLFRERMLRSRPRRSSAERLLDGKSRA